MIVTRHEITEVQSPSHALLTKCWPALPKRVRFRGEIFHGEKHCSREGILMRRWVNTLPTFRDVLFPDKGKSGIFM